MPKGAAHTRQETAFPAPSLFGQPVRSVFNGALLFWGILTVAAGRRKWFIAWFSGIVFIFYRHIFIVKR
jgi:hypothetical protein